MSQNPIFVFVPGAWHTPDTFDKLRALMHDRGLETEAIATPSVNASSPDQGLHADIHHTKSVLQRIVDTGREVVLVNHSYGGVVGAGAVEGLGYAQRAHAGLRGGVIMAVWMAAFVMPKGVSLVDKMGGKWSPWVVFNDPDDGYVFSSRQEEIFYNDLPPEEQQEAISKLRSHSKRSFEEPALHEPWHEIPTMYMFCELDGAVSLPTQEFFAKTLGTKVTYRLKSSHSPFLSVPEQVIDGLEIAVKEGRQQSGIAVS